MKIEALDDKGAKRVAEVKVQTFVTLPSEIKAKSLIDTLAEWLTDVEIDTWRNSGPNILRGACRNFGSRAKKGGCLDCY